MIAHLPFPSAAPLSANHPQVFIPRQGRGGRIAMLPDERVAPGGMRTAACGARWPGRIHRLLVIGPVGCSAGQRPLELVQQRSDHLGIATPLSVSMAAWISPLAGSRPDAACARCGACWLRAGAPSIPLRRKPSAGAIQHHVQGALRERGKWTGTRRARFDSVV